MVDMPMIEANEVQEMVSDYETELAVKDARIDELEKALYRIKRSAELQIGILEKRAGNMTPTLSVIATYKQDIQEYWRVMPEPLTNGDREDG